MKTLRAHGFNQRPRFEQVVGYLERNEPLPLDQPDRNLVCHKPLLPGRFCAVQRGPQPPAPAAHVCKQFPRKASALPQRPRTRTCALRGGTKGTAEPALLRMTWQEPQQAKNKRKKKAARKKVQLKPNQRRRVRLISPAATGDDAGQSGEPPRRRRKSPAARSSLSLRLPATRTSGAARPALSLWPPPATSGAARLMSPRLPPARAMGAERKAPGSRRPLPAGSAARQVRAPAAHRRARPRARSAREPRHCHRVGSAGRLLTLSPRRRPRLPSRPTANTAA